MAVSPFDSDWRKKLACRGLVLGLLPLFGCAEIEVGIEAAKRINRALEPADSVQVAQATTSARQTEAEAEPPISPYLEPAPAIFEATGLAVWDGNRTLQGIWVAHPLATTARRVRIFNEITGQAVDGALFKRDTAQGGPSVLISSEAATKLGLVPGESTELRIVAVTPVRRDAPKPGNQQQQPLDETATPVANETLAETGDSDNQQAAGEASSETQAEAEPETQTSEAETASTEASAEAEAGTAEAEVPETQATETTAEAEPAEETVLAAAPTPTPRPAAPSDTEEGVSFKWDSAAESAEESAARDPKPLNDPAPAVPGNSGTDEAAPKTEPDPAKQAAVTKPEPEPARPATSTLKKPYVQAGVFGVASNAHNLVARLKQKGIPALTRKAGGKLTRVLAGPFQTTADRTAALIAIRNLGLRDAVPVKR